MSLPLTAAGLAVEIDGVRLLDAVDFSATPGRVHALIGPNGAGKSTLLAALAGDRAAASGTVHLGDTAVASQAPKALARLRAVLTQEHTVSFPFPVREIVAMGRHPWAGSAAADDDDHEIDAAMAATDVSHLAARTVPSLSGGERARVALARIVAQRTPVLLLDEPTAALDLKHQEDVLRLARSLAASGHAVVMVVHDLSLAGAVADRVALLSRGALVSVGAPSEVLTAEAISEVYGLVVRVIELDGRPHIVPARS